MNNKDLFTHLNIVLKKNAINNTTCDAIIDEIKNGMEQESIIRKNTALRKTNKFRLSKTLTKQLEEFIKNTIQPELEMFFNLKLNPVHPFEALYYKEGHFFKPHRDDIKIKNSNKYKKITVVLFLNEGKNQQSQKEYEGGELRLYGLFKKFPSHFLAIPNEKGTLVAFPSDIIHEVSKIEWGKRYTLVVWFV